MSSPSEEQADPTWRRSVKGPARWFTMLLAALAVAAFVAGCVRTYGDVDELHFGHPEPLTSFIGVAVGVAVLAAAGGFRLRRGDRVITGLFTAALGGTVAGFAVVATGEQSFPRPGGLWLLLAAIDVVLIGLWVAVGVGDAGSRASRRRRLSTDVTALLVVAGGLVAVVAGPTWWPTHNAHATTTSAPPLTGDYPTSFSAVAWKRPLASDEEFAGAYGGRIIVTVSDVKRCLSGVRALDARTGNEVWHYLVPNRCKETNRVDQLSVDGDDALLQVAVGDTVAAFLDPTTGRVLDRGSLQHALFFVSGNLGVAQDKSGSVLSTTRDDAKVTVFGYDLAHRTEVWRRPAPTCANGQLEAVLGPPSRLDASFYVRPTAGSGNTVVDLPDSGFAMGYSCRTSQTSFDEHVWVVRPGGRDQDIDLGPAQLVDVQPVPVLLSTPHGLLIQTLNGIENVGADGVVKWTSEHGKSDELGKIFSLDDGSVLVAPAEGERATVRLDATSGTLLSSDGYFLPGQCRVHGHLVYDTDLGGIVLDALHPTTGPAPFDVGAMFHAFPIAVLPGVEVIGNQHQIVAIR